jgi:hypothetical protein
MTQDSVSLFQSELQEEFVQALKIHMLIDLASVPH